MQNRTKLFAIIAGLIMAVLKVFIRVLREQQPQSRSYREVT